jgi:hypothetical protein
MFIYKNKVSEDLSLDKPLQCHIQSQQISL